VSDFHICIDMKRADNLSQAQIDALTNIIRQCRSDEDIRRDNAAAQADYERERRDGWSVK
jgi:flagellar motor switch protein FliM